jgi:uncharacterized protein YukE
MDKQLPAVIQRLAAATHAALQAQRHQQVAASYRRLEEARAQLQQAEQRRRDPRAYEP